MLYKQRYIRIAVLAVGKPAGFYIEIPKGADSHLFDGGGEYRMS